MKRREFMALVGSAAAAGTLPVVALAQQPARLPTIGFLGTSTFATQSQSTTAFVQGLRELGWIEDRTVSIQYWWAEGRPERFVEIAAECIRLKVDVIVTAGTRSVAMAKQATSIIPIVFALAADPVGAGLVASLTRPGGNVTGVSVQRTDAARKMLELLREVVPDLGRIALLANANNNGVAEETSGIQIAAQTLGLVVVPVEVRNVEDIIPALQAIDGHADALYVASDPLTFANRDQILTFALVSNMPTIFSIRDYVDAGGLMSYAANVPDQFKRAAGLVDKILRGAKPADMPVEQPTRFDIVINLKTATAIGLRIPKSLLLRADVVME